MQNLVSWNRLNLPTLSFLNNSNSAENKLSDEQESLMALIPFEMHKHAIIWITQTGATSKLLKEYSIISKNLFVGIDMDKFPHFVNFGCNKNVIDFNELPISQKYSIQRILVVLATEYISLYYCPQIVYLIKYLLNKIDEKCVFAITHSMLNPSKKNKNSKYFPFNYLNYYIQIQIFLSLIVKNLKTITLHLKQNKIKIKKLITSGLSTMWHKYLNDDTYLALIDKFIRHDDGYITLIKFGISLIKNSQKSLLQTKNLKQWNKILIKYSKKLTPNHVNSWSWHVFILNNSIQKLDEFHRNRALNLHKINKINTDIIRLWPQWNGSKISDYSQIFTKKEIYFQIWAWLPHKYHLSKPKMLFSTQTDGYKLVSLYDQCFHHENLIIFIKTSQNEIFGAFITTIGEKQHFQNFLYDNNAFLFILNSNKNGVESVKMKPDINVVLSVLPTNKSLSIGYDKYNLIFIDESLKTGISNGCPLLNVTSLCSGHNGSGHFDIACIEVWCVEHDYNKNQKKYKKNNIHELVDIKQSKISNVLFSGRHNVSYTGFKR